MPSPLDSLPNDVRHLIQETEIALHQIIRVTNLTREQAMAVKDKMCRPIGLLNVKFSLKFDADTTNAMLKTVRPQKMI